MKQEIKIGFDMSSFIWRGLPAGVDSENGRKVQFNDKTITVNSGEYGYDNVVNMMLEVMATYKATPIDCVLVFEGASSKSKRLLISSDYKASRESRAPEAYESFEVCKQMLTKTFLELGACVVTQDYCEGDDTLAYLAKHSEVRFIVASYDGDLTALTTERNEYGAEVESWINGLRGVNKYGDFPHHLVTGYKALVGDGNEYPGCKGFGKVAFEKFLAEFGVDGLQQFQDMCEKSSLDDLHAMEHPLIAKIVASEETVLMSYELAKMRPEWVNTVEHPLQIKAGMVALYPEHPDDRLKKWYGQVWVVTADTFEQASAFALARIAYSPFVALDIETSTPDESDEWLARCGNPEGVDVFGSELTGMGLTFGDNNQYTMYFSIDHADTNNCTSRQVCDFVAQIKIETVIQNVSFELTVLHQAWGEWLKDNGCRGFLPNVLDTALEASYVDENSKRGLKERSLSTLGYTQETYDHVTKLTGPVGTLPKGGRLICTTTTGLSAPSADPSAPALEFVETHTHTETRRYKMRELSALHVLSYGADDTRCTAALHNHYKFVMQLEHTYSVYKEVEIDAAYANAEAFLAGIQFSMERMIECEKEDEASVALAWPVLRSFLIANGWEGTVPPVYAPDLSLVMVKEAFTIVTGKPLDTMVRTPAKLVTLIREVEGEAVFAGMLERCYTGEAGAEAFTKYVQDKFSGEPIFNSDSPVQMKKLMYETLGLPIRLTNKVTDAQRARGERTGTPKTDDLAVQSALHYDAATHSLEVLKAIQTIKQCGTRSKLFYTPYKSFPHWKDGKLHPSTNQCATVTRRNSASNPNYTQWPAKGDGIKFREAIVASAIDRVVISADCSGQELRLAADLSRDPNMLSCYIGENKKDIHSIVAAAAAKYLLGAVMSYEEFYAALKGADEVVADKMDVLRTKSKTVNFGEIYGAQALSLSSRLLVPEAEAQLFLDAKKAMFPLVDKWKESVVTQARAVGYSLTMLGARRHMRDVLAGGDRWEVQRAERQLPNYCIQGSGAEAIKIALGRVFRSEVMRKNDVKIIGSIHDEIVLDCPASAAYEVATELVKFMEAPYGGMIVPFISECTLGKDFGKQLKLPQKFTEKDVQEKLDKLFA